MERFVIKKGKHGDTKVLEIIAKKLVQHEWYYSGTKLLQCVYFTRRGNLVYTVTKENSEISYTAEVFDSVAALESGMPQYAKDIVPKVKQALGLIELEPVVEFWDV